MFLIWKGQSQDGAFDAAKSRPEIFPVMSNGFPFANAQRKV